MPYWSIQDVIWPAGSWQHDLMLRWGQTRTKLGKAQFKKDYPRINALLKKQTARRLAWRLANPAGDAALVRFYDYNPAKKMIGKGSI